MNASKGYKGWKAPRKPSPPPSGSQVKAAAIDSAATGSSDRELRHALAECRWALVQAERHLDEARQLCGLSFAALCGSLAALVTLAVWGAQ